MKDHIHGENEEDESLLPTTEQPVIARSKRRHIFIWDQWIGFTIAMTVTAILGYILGSTRARVPTHYGLLSPPGDFKTKWEHNLTFTQKPDAESEAVWSSIIPVGRGFIHHPQLAPFVSNIAVFHQLHCLHAMYFAYYAALESPAMSNISDIPDFDETTGTRTAIFHIRHCYDYLRQALMCASDTNLEALDHERHVTNGWGQPKVCRDYQKVFEFAEKYANSTDKGIVT